MPGTTHWSIRNLAMMLSRLLNIKAINPESVRKTLKEHRLKPHHMENYLTRTDPDFFSKAERIFNIYQSPPNGGLVISVDERTAIQVAAQAPAGGTLPEEKSCFKTGWS